tara:strand:+ start:262 stop:429 length:168 start_codon:yes stop_codon:yes gene_type:complete
MPFKLIDTHTGNVVGTYQKSSTAHKKKNAKDNEYGGYRFSVRKASVTKKKKTKKA